MLRKMVMLCIAGVVLGGCGGGGSSTPDSLTPGTSTGGLSGFGQKGPFLVGSTVTLYQLDSSNAERKGASVSTTVTDSKGSFSASPSWSGWTEIEVGGKSFDEHNNRETGNNLALVAITNLGSNQPKVGVNVLTHLAAARIRELVKTTTLANAYDQAQTELKSALALKSTKVETLNMLESSDGEPEDNAALLLLSGAFHGIGGDTTTLAELAEDFADDGQFNKFTHFKKMQYVIGKVNYLTDLRNNLVGRDATVAPPGENQVSGNVPIRNQPDPLYGQQWHLPAIKHAAATNCAVHELTCRGEGVLVGVLDDGLEIAHEDLRDSMAYRKSRNFNESDNSKAAYFDPTPADSGDSHGTMVAGLIAATDHNGKGVQGVAPRASLAGFNILITNTTGAFANALGNKEIMVSNNSWGPTDGLCTYQEAEELNDQAIQAAVEGSAQNPAARDGKGAIVLFASGNGGDSCELGDTDLADAVGGDQSSMDGAASNRYVIPVAALDKQNRKTYYAERGSNILVAAPAGNRCDGESMLVTTDLSGERGNNSGGGTNELENATYTQCMNGTSGATPIVAGVVALMLQANPNLGWRDVRAILAKTAQKNDGDDAEWKQNTVSKLYVHPYYGYGLVDAEAAVLMAKTWQNLPLEKRHTVVGDEDSPIVTLNPQDDAVDSPTHTVTVGSGEAGFNVLETVQVGVVITHQRAGDIELVLEHRDTSDNLISSEYLVRLNGDASDTYKEVVFTSAQHLYDTPEGKWVLKATDRYANNTGSVTWAGIAFYGHQSAQ